jgi:hypothetical protein
MRGSYRWRALPREVPTTTGGGILGPRRSPLDFTRVFDRVAGVLDEGAHPYAVIGALALHAYGHSRVTFDLDLATTSAAQEAVMDLLGALGYEALHVSPGYSSHQHADADWGGVDLVYVDDVTAGLLFPVCPRRLKLGNREAPVPRAEHLAAMKVQAMRNDPSRLLPDLADAQYLLRLPGTDRDEVRGYFEKAGLLDWYDRLVETL